MAYVAKTNTREEWGGGGAEAQGHREGVGRGLG